MQTEVIMISGMECEACSGHVTSALEALEGVASVDVRLAEGRATVVFDPARVSVEEMRRVIDEEGYEAAPSR